MEQTRIILASDIHFCDEGWYDFDKEARATALVADLAREYEKEAFAALLLLGDYSLDHWAFNTKGKYLTTGQSDTAAFCENYLPHLVPQGVTVRMMAGNHEQFGEEMWQQLTGGHSRSGHLVIGSYLFIFCDTFGGDLDPTEHSDGTYIGTNAAEVEALMAQYPEKKVVLCAHWFDMERENQDFLALLQSEARIVCLICGHNHKSRVAGTGEEYGNKPLLYTGHYSYSGEKNNVRCLAGFRELILGDDGFTSRYIVPSHTYKIGSVCFTTAFATQDEIEITF